MIADLLVGTTGPSEIVKQHAAVHQYPTVLAGVTHASAPVEYDPNIIDESDTVQCVGTCRWSLLVLEYTYEREKRGSDIHLTTRLATSGVAGRHGDKD